MRSAGTLPILLLLGFAAAAAVSSTAASLGGSEDGSAPWRRSMAEDSSAHSLSNDYYPLAADRTLRKDPLNRYEPYTGGWNISSRNYWASVGFTAAPFFVIAFAWFVIFGLILLLLSFYCCCCRRRTYSYSRAAYALSLILLIIFTCAAIVGCVVLYVGQGNFHASTTKTLDYVVGQANFTFENLKNLSSNLGAAKTVGVDQVFLPDDIQKSIDSIDAKLNASTNDLATRTSDNSKKIRGVLDIVGLDLITISAVMLFLAFIGFVFSILGFQFLVYILVIVGWILVACTFILCGVFLLFHNVVSDTCAAMDDWVQRPHAHTALDDILPCVDASTANDTLYQSRQVTFQLVNVVNQVITNISNQDIPLDIGPPLSYNQSGPLVPVLCNPYLPDMSNRTCTLGEVDFYNASQVWKGFVCEASGVDLSQVCTTEGRLTPSLYDQMTGASSLSQGLYYYSPFLVQLEDCTFVRDTFASISSDNCPGLGRFSGWIYMGLAMVSVAVMLSLVFWVVYARERRYRMYNKAFLARNAAHPSPYAL